MRRLIVGKRGPGRFPVPVAPAGGNNKIQVYDVRAAAPWSGPRPYNCRKYADQGGTPIKVNHCPAGIAVSADGRNLWTANSSSDSVSVVDPGDSGGHHRPRRFASVPGCSLT